MEFTTCLAVDGLHVKELEESWKSWRIFKPEIMDNPLLIICDGSVMQWENRLSFIDHTDWDLIPWEPEITYESQREKMLTALTLLPGRCVETEWFLKLDTDAVATGRADWIEREWFDLVPTFISNPWGYTKPADAIDRLDDWGDTNALSSYKRLNLPYPERSNKVKHRRIISWLMFVNTEWNNRNVLPLIGEKLPVPSQDTLLWYIAKRRRQTYLTVKFKEKGWSHLCGLNKIRRTVRSLSRYS